MQNVTKELTPEQRLQQFVKMYEKMSEDELLEVIRSKTAELGRLPQKSEIPAAYYFKHKYGPWPRVLEAAGVKEVSPSYLRRKTNRAANRQAKKEKKKAQMNKVE